MTRVGKAVTMNRIMHSLALAALAIDARDYTAAIGLLQDARLLAKTLKSVKGRAIAAHCVVAQQAIMPYLMRV